MTDDVNRTVKHYGNLSCRQAPEVMELDQLGQGGVFLRQELECTLNAQHAQRLRPRRLRELQLPTCCCLRAALDGGPRAGMIDQHLPHDSRGESKKVRPVSESAPTIG